MSSWETYGKRNLNKLRFVSAVKGQLIIVEPIVADVLFETIRPDTSENTICSMVPILDNRTLVVPT
ncbi:conserved hypothetical protein [Ricinus communis]|uniref:Uncharacterized protein n=1 Tax=Ricinus communis TaxID=3988 RepID=B9SEW4_RICCO|nr:conserved hypothetical protein [Ricinus communis]